MAKQILNLQELRISEDDVDMVDGARFSTVSHSHCGNWSVRSYSHC